jgi:hypothetical protein
MDAQISKGLEKERREMSGVVGVWRPVRRRDVRQWDAHVLLDGVGCKERLRIHRVEILDAVAELHVRATLGYGSSHGIVQHDAAQATDMNGA